MHAPSKILVPVDFSEPSRAALEYAGLIGARFGAEVDVLHVWRRADNARSKEELLAEFMRSEAGHKMMEWLASFELRSDVEAHGRLASGVRGDVPDAIVGTVESGAYDLIVMGTHGRQGLSHLLHGSVAEKVMSRATCPVVTIRAPDDGAVLAVDADRLELDERNVWSWPS